MSPDGLAERLAPHLAALFTESCRGELVAPEAIREHTVALEKLLYAAGLVPQCQSVSPIPRRTLGV
jgi:hypothetical protein